MSSIEQSFQSGKAQAEGERQADRAVESVKGAAGAATDTAQQQEHRAAGTVQQAGESAAQMAQGAVAAVKDAVSGGK